MQTFQNQATLSYNGKTLVSNTTRGTISDVLSITKTAANSDYGSGTNHTFVVSIANSGTTAYTGLTLTDNLGAYSFTPEGGTAISLQPLNYVSNSVMYYVNGTLQTTPTITPGTDLIITGISVPAQGNATIVYTAQTNEYAPLASTASVTNTAALTGTGIAVALADDATITPSGEPNLSIVKSLNPTTVSGTGTVTYTFDILNTGNSEAVETDNVVVSDTFTPVLSNITVTLNGTALTTSQYSYNTTTGVFSTNVGVITVPAATYQQDAATGVIETTPGESVLTVSGTVSGN